MRWSMKTIIISRIISSFNQNFEIYSLKWYMITYNNAWPNKACLYIYTSQFTIIKNNLILTFKIIPKTMCSSFSVCKYTTIYIFYGVINLLYRIGCQEHLKEKKNQHWVIVLNLSSLDVPCSRNPLMQAGVYCLPCGG